MKRPILHRRVLVLLAVVVPLAGLFGYVALRSGPLAPVAVTVAPVESRSLAPALFGIGTVEARYTYRIGPTSTGRLLRLSVQVGDHVIAGQVIGEMDPVDLDKRIAAQASTVKAAEAALREAQQRQRYASTQAGRYARLYEARATSEENAATKRHELRIAETALTAAEEQLARARAEQEVLLAQRADLRLIAPVDGLVAERTADPGSAIVAGQAVVNVIDPGSYWVNVRFDQVGAAGLAQDLPARVVLRSRGGQVLHGRVLRVEPMADAVTEELLAKVVFQTLPEPLPSVGELAEVTVDMPALPAALVIPNAAIRREHETTGVWQLMERGLRFAPVRLGAADLDGYVQVAAGLERGDRIVVYSEKALAAHHRVQVVEHIVGAPR
ncbi:efflux RND transporter periplasmic adaptor subunit [Pseudomonas oligotrophica]|uniref:efflux RND transporter periplasmic adaptor subunit n=1 Tax=Pseudomonas oligotrophica TaxID=2912055 RepID=UPI001F02E9DC|nr:efflux RND transporter periplasmic adaptor subunit [Pseudomonas oligotrophica]MCF7203018.1 efflux RND transporter periplasmic adaptor subunit [Pseudomonas oligotrophica]